MKKNITKDFEISKDDFDTTYAKILKKDPKRLAAFKKRVIADFNKTHNLEVFLNNLKILVMAGNVSAFAKKVKIQRPNVYKALNPQGNPSFATIMTITDNLGISLNARI
ncbi:MAG: DNA-binding protein [Elusimicrobiaceae bacterium]|nr:hypothetical protein [Elusimicrobiota bacterium]